VKNGLGNRLRAFASAASVAAALGRPVMVVWVSDPHYTCTCKCLTSTYLCMHMHMLQVSDLHCNCSFRNLFKLPLKIAVLEEELPLANLTADRFQVCTRTRAAVVCCMPRVRSFLTRRVQWQTHASLPGVQLHAAGAGGSQRRAGGDQL